MNIIDPGGAFGIDLSSAVGFAILWIRDMLEIFTNPPAVYFVAFAIVGAAAGVARKFVPMKRK